MNVRRVPFQDTPDTLQEHCQQLGVPLVLCDHLVSRRQRLHVLLDPTGEPPYFDTDLCDILHRLALGPTNRVALMHQDEAGGVTTCYIRLESTTAEAP